MSDTTTREHAERIARLEQIAADTRDALTGIRSDMAALRAELVGFRAELVGFRAEMTAELRAVRGEAKSDYRWLVGMMLGGFATMLAGFTGLLGVMAHGFHWL